LRQAYPLDQVTITDGESINTNRDQFGMGVKIRPESLEFHAGQDVVPVTGIESFRIEAVEPESVSAIVPKTVDKR
jgi:hypothetical protein